MSTDIEHDPLQGLNISPEGYLLDPQNRTILDDEGNRATPKVSLVL